MARKVPDIDINKAANPPVTFTVEQMNKAVAAAVADAVAKQKTKVDAAVAAMSVKSDRAIKNELQTIRAFKKIGVNATPHVDTFTFNIWASKGFRPKEGTKAVRVNNLRLFHKSQCRPITAEEVKEMKEQQIAAIKRYEGKVIPMTPQQPQLI
jgi:hypothetical protein